MTAEWTAVLVILGLLAAAVNAESVSWPFMTNKCLYDSSDRCNAAVGGRLCRWCENPLGCFPLDRLDEIQHFCERVSRKPPNVEIECEYIATKQECLSQELCRWCTSKVVDDACFGMMEARRLPHQVFNCSVIPDYLLVE